MGTVAAGQPFSFNYNTTDHNTGLFVRADIIDVTTSPTLLTRVVMTEFSNGIYVGTYTGIAGKAYVINKLVYTDGTYATVDSSRSPDSDDIQVISFSPSLTVQEVNGSILDMELTTNYFDLEIVTEEVV